VNKKQKVLLWIITAVVIIILIPLVLFAKQYYDARYVLDDSYYTVVPLDYDITPYRDQDGRVTDYTLTCYNADGEAKVHTFSVLVDTHKSDLYPPGTFIKVDVSRQLVIGRRAVDEKDIPEKALEKIKESFTPSTATTLAEYADERTRHLAMKGTGAQSISCAQNGTGLVYTYVYSAEGKTFAENAADLLDPVYYAQFRTDKDAFPELTAIVLEIMLSDDTMVFTQEYNTRVMFDYEK